jgi:O-antigen/teichoic acid export membrane protein
MSANPSTMSSPRALGLRARVLRAGGWSLGGFALNQALRFGSSLVTTRLLAPEMFGVMAIAVTLMTGLAMFSDLGLRQSIVQSPRGTEPAYLNTAWTIQILRGAVIWALGLAASLVLHELARRGLVPARSVYAAPDLPAVIAVLSAASFIAGFESTRAAEASRRLALGRLTQIELTAQIVGLVVMLTWASHARSIWALVGGSLATGATRTILSHVWLPGTANRWQSDASALAELVGFGKWIFAASILGFLVSNGDRVLLGGAVGAAVLGAYSIAFLAFGAVEQILGKLVGDVSFPALSEVARDRPAELRRVCYQFHLPIAALAYGGTGFLGTAGQGLMGLLYDRRYEDSGWMLEILALALLSIPSRIGAISLLALGVPRLHAQILAVRLAALVVFLPLGFAAFDLRGAIWGIVASYLASVPMTMIYQARLGILDIRRELLLLPAIGVGAVLARAVLALLA